MQCIHAPRIHFKVLPVLLSVAVCISLMGSGYAQCFTSNQFPENTIPASPFANVETIISTESKTGFYQVISNLQVGKKYVFISSNLNDYVTVRINGGTEADPPLNDGPVEHTFTATSHILEFHLTVNSPQCDSDDSIRTTSIVCVDCESEPSRVGVNNPSPSATLDVNGNLKIADENGLPEAGMIRFNSTTNDFEGYDGQKWLSLTQAAASWGRIPQANGVEDNRATALDGAADDRFGFSVSISDNYAVVGATQADIESNTDQGAAYIFVRSGTTWTEQAKLTALDGAADDRFGYSVRISGDYAVIGAPFADVESNDDQGAAYIFVRSGATWTEQAKLTANDGGAGDWFGYSVSISGDYVVCGANKADGFNAGSGAAYIFARSGTSWTQQPKLTANDVFASANFGVSVSISGDYVVCGAPNANIGSNVNQGAAYVFVRSGTSWTQQTKLTAGAPFDLFGQSVSISGDDLIVGAPQADTLSNTNQGVAYVFVRSDTTWTQQAILTAADGAQFDEFGVTVGISGDNTVVGGFQSRAAYVFVRSDTTWTQQVKLTASDGVIWTFVSESVSISGDNVVVGARTADIGPNDFQGAAYFFCRK